MIESQNLREGNLIKHMNRICAVCEIGIFNIGGGESNSSNTRPNGVSVFPLNREEFPEWDGIGTAQTVHILNIHDIALANEWLKRLGFKWTPYPKKSQAWTGKHRTGLWMRNGIGMVRDDELDPENWELWMVNEKGVPVVMLRWIQVIRQLQNLYMDLREEILIIDEEDKGMKSDLILPEMKIIKPNE